MFEDSTFESTGKIQTRSRGWMIAAFVFDASILLALILIPIIYPEVLPRLSSFILMVAPTPPPEEPKAVARPEHAPAPQLQMRGGELQAQSTIPKQIYIPSAPEPPAQDTVAALGDSGPGTGNTANPFPGRGTNPAVREAVQKQHVSSGVMEGMLVYKVVPNYPAIPREIRLSGTVVLQATISKTGAIENLRVVSGPAMLQQAAMNAVAQWRYRPYLLNGEPVEVETTINVQFTLQ
jgi:periplasmic protein TonB